MAGVELVGRRAELAQLEATVERAAEGSLQLALVEGEAGIGKSTLLRAVRDRVSASGVTVLHGKGDDLERDRPFRAVGEALAPVGGPAATDGGHRLADAMVDALEAIAIDGPVLLALDDLQWADTDTLRVLRTGIRRLADLPVAAVLACRPSPWSRELAATLDDASRAGAEQLLLQPLDGGAVAELAGQELRARCSSRLAAELARTGGNPLYVLELLASLKADGLVSVTDGEADLDATSALPPGLRHTIVRRLSALAPATLDLLRMASVLGTAFAPDDLAVVLDRPVTELLVELRSALDAGILTDHDDAGDRLAFRHDLIRAAVYEDLPAAVRAALHLDVAHALDRSGTPPGALVGHLDLGAERRDEATFDLLRRVADAVRHHTPAAAVRLYERALAMVGDDQAVRDELLAGIGVPLASIGRIDQAEHIARELLGRPHDRALGPSLREALHHALIRQGRTADDVAVLERVASDPTLSDTERLERQTDLAHALTASGQIDRAAALVADNLPAARAAGDRRSTVRNLLVAIPAALCHGHVAHAVELGREAVALDKALDRRVTAEFMYGVALVDADRVDEAQHVLADGRRFEVELGEPTTATIYHWSLAGVHYLAGRWDDSLAEIDAGRAYVAEGTGAPLGLLVPHGLAARIHVHRGEVASAEAELAAASAHLGARGPESGIDVVLWARAAWLLEQGEANAAAAVLSGVWGLLGEARYFMGWRLFAPDLVRFTAERDDISTARAAAELAVVGAERSGGVPSAEAAALRCHAAIDRDAAAAAKAAAVLAESPRVVEAAWATEDAGRLAVAVGDREVGVAHLHDALGRWEALGASADVARVDQLLRRCGVRRTGTRRQRPMTGWESLTPSEARVVELVASGLTNPRVAERLYVSPRTVETHLSHVFAKLGLRSRVELAAAWTRRNPV